MVGEFFIINNDYKVEVISYKNNKEVTYQGNSYLGRN